MAQDERIEGVAFNVANTLAHRTEAANRVSSIVGPDTVKALELGRGMADLAVEMFRMCPNPELERSFCDIMNTVIGATISGITCDSVGMRRHYGL